MSLVSSVPKIDPEEFENMLNSNMKVSERAVWLSRYTSISTWVQMRKPNRYVAAHLPCLSWFHSKRDIVWKRSIQFLGLKCSFTRSSRLIPKSISKHFLACLHSRYLSWYHQHWMHKSMMKVIQHMIVFSVTGSAHGYLSIKLDKNSANNHREADNLHILTDISNPRFVCCYFFFSHWLLLL